MAQRKTKKVKEIVGDGEEIEVEDAEDLSKNDIDQIYKRFRVESSFDKLQTRSPTFQSSTS